MIYAMSDLHGCYNKFIGMLEKIHFGEKDTLYILGDIVDRGADGIKLLLNLAERKNVICLRGNHDNTALRMLNYLKTPADSPLADKLIEIYQLWLSDGSYPTYKAFTNLDEDNKKKVLTYLNSLPIFDEITVAGCNFFLSHTGPKQEKMQNFDSCEMNDFLIGEIEYEKIYFKDKFFVSGHTPTELIDESCKGRIFRKNNHIAVDCGAIFGNPLGCICLNTLEEFYYSNTENAVT